MEKNYTILEVKGGIRISPWSCLMRVIYTNFVNKTHLILVFIDNVDDLVISIYIYYLTKSSTKISITWAIKCMQSAFSVPHSHIDLFHMKWNTWGIQINPETTFLLLHHHHLIHPWWLPYKKSLEARSCYVLIAESKFTHTHSWAAETKFGYILSRYAL